MIPDELLRVRGRDPPQAPAGGVQDGGALAGEVGAHAGEELVDPHGHGVDEERDPRAGPGLEQDGDLVLDLLGQQGEVGGEHHQLKALDGVVHLPAELQQAGGAPLDHVVDALDVGPEVGQGGQEVVAPRQDVQDLLAAAVDVLEGGGDAGERVVQDDDLQLAGRGPAQRQGDERLGHRLRGPVQDGVLHPDVAPPNEVNTGPAQADLVCYGHGRATCSWSRLRLVLANPLQKLVACLLGDAGLDLVLFVGMLA